MAVTTTNLVQGPGVLYSGAFGVTEPATVVTAPGAGWTDCGGTKGGLKVTVNQDYSTLEVDQVVDIPERRLTRREVIYEVDLAEVTLANLKLALNGGAITVSGAQSTYVPAMDTAATQVTYSALLFDGFAPGGFKRRWILRKALMTDQVETSALKDGQTVFSTKFSSHYVSSSITPYVVQDQTA